MSNLPRLFRILSITAKFRLYEFAEGSRDICCCGCFCCPSLYDICFPETSTGTERAPAPCPGGTGPDLYQIGPATSTRRDFLPPALADELAALQDRVPPFSEPKVAS